VRVKVRIPPDGSFLSSTIYEGLLRLLAAGARVTGPNELEAPPDVLRSAFRQVAEWARDGLKLANTGKNDVKYIKILLQTFNIRYEDIAPRKKPKKGEKEGAVAKKLPYGRVIDAIASSDDGWGSLRDTTLRIEVDIKSRAIYVSATKKDALQLPVFKPDRYKGIRLPEAGIVTDMYQFGVGREAALIALLGMGGAHVASIGGMHFFLFIDPGMAAEVLTAPALGKDPSKVARAYLDARDAGAKALRGLEDAIVYAEAAVSRLVLDLAVRRAMRAGNISRLALRLVRVDEEGNTYKIYSDVPVTIAAGEAEYAEVLADHLDPGSPIIRCLRKEAMRLRVKGVQPCEEGPHVVSAALWLFRYVTAGSAEFLSHYVRELVAAADIAEVAEKGGRAATYRRMAASLLRVMR